MKHGLSCMILRVSSKAPTLQAH